LEKGKLKPECRKKIYEFLFFNHNTAALKPTDHCPNTPTLGVMTLKQLLFLAHPTQGHQLPAPSHGSLNPHQIRNARADT
jgi:hypothetical protein